MIAINSFAKKEICYTIKFSLSVVAMQALQPPPSSTVRTKSWI
jgi:hypothetical protein